MESIIARIQKLLALGERGGTEAEANSAMQKVHELLAKYNLSLDDVAEAPVKDEDYIRDETDASSRQPWQDYVWASVSRLYFCQHFRRITRTGNKHLVIGKPSNLAVVKYVAAYLVRTGEALARESATNSESRQTFINSFKKGFACRIAARVSEEIKKAREGRMTDSATGTALVVLPLYEQAKRDIDRFLSENEMHPRAGRGRGMDVSNHAGFSAGRKAADGVSLAANGLESQQRAAIAGRVA